MIDTTLAKRYAKALVAIGQENNALASYGTSLSALLEVTEASKEFKEVLINPVFTKEDKREIARGIMEKMGTDPIVRNFVSLLIDRKRIDQLPGIVKAFQQYLDDISGIRRGTIISATALSADEIGKVTDALSRISGTKVLATAEVDPSLIGGLVAKVGDQVFDGTIRTQLNQLKESLKG
ncbi:MAG: ATP synthase F1 subunit delta [Thermodesulfobacteriota bacterium]